MAGECQKLKFNRRRMGLSQKQFAELVGLCQYTISKLEKSEDAWTVASTSTIDKIYAVYENMASYQPNKKEVKNIMDDIRNEEDDLIDPKALDALSGIEDTTKQKTDDDLIDPKALDALSGIEDTTKQKPDDVIDEKDALNVDDLALKELINVAYAGMSAARSHEEFAAYIKLLKKLVKKY